MDRLKRIDKKEGIHCDSCDKTYKRVRHFRFFKGQQICHECFFKKMTRIPNNGEKRGITLEKALNRTYRINFYVTKQGRIIATKGFPQCLAGRKIKIALVE